MGDCISIVYNCNCSVKTEGLVEVTGSHYHYQYLGISALRATYQKRYYNNNHRFTAIIQLNLH